MSLKTVYFTNARRTGSAMTDSTGRFTIPIGIPSAIGTYTYDSGTSYHYFDQCGVSASLDDNGSISDSEIIFHLVYKVYHPH